MNRREFLKIGSLASAGLLAGCGLSQTTSADNSLKDKRPNIVLVITDDQGYGDLSCHGNPILKTPNLDALHAESVRFTRFQVSPTCAPTRSAIMSGRHEFKNGVTHTILERERMSLETAALAETLRNAGYTTGIFGKWHLGDEDAYQPDNRGFDEVFIHGCGGIGQKYAGSCADAPANKYFDPAIKHNGKFVKTKGFCTDVFFRQALGWINKQRKNKRPFFAYITTNAPHSPYIAPDKYKEPFLEKGLDEKTAGFYGMIVNIDDNMKLLTDKLAEWRLQENTLLVFMTDNGSAAGGKIFNAGMKGGKGTAHEGGTRVPAFFRWKGMLAEGVDVNCLTAHIDMYPTFVELAGAKLPDNGQVEGRSLIPLLKDADARWEDRFLFTHVGRWEKGAEPDEYKYKRCAIRSQRFRFVNNEELYDMEADPGQKVNVIDKHPEIVQEMRQAYEAWWNQTRPLMVNEDAIYKGGEPPFFKQ